MTDPRVPDMGAEDSFEDEDEGLLGDDLDGDPGESRSAGNAPGSLTSLRIRKRAPTPRAWQQEPRLAARPETPSGREIKDTTPSLDPDRFVQAPRATPPSATVRRPVATQAAPGAMADAPLRPDPLLSRPVPQVEAGPKGDAASGAAPGARALGTNLTTYWTQLKGSHQFPKVGDLDHGYVTATWPNSIMMRCRPGSKSLQPDRVFSSTAGGSLSDLRASGRITLSPMMLQWLLGLAGEVLRAGRPMRDEEEFPSSSRSTRYRAVALPFSDDDRTVDHVLCHVSPAN